MANAAAVPSIELQRTLVKSPPELWDELASNGALRRCLGDVRVKTAVPPSRLEWDGRTGSGVIELEASGWGTKIRAHAEARQPSIWSIGRPKSEELERCLEKLLDHLGSSSLTSGRDH
jgi:hypothetical protein